MKIRKNKGFPTPSIGVAGIVFNDQGQVLLIKRNKPPASGLWSIPGGRLEPGESLKEACRREVKEETGLDVAVTTLAAVVERQMEGFHYVIIDYLARLTNSESAIPIAQSDVLDAQWVSLENLSGFDLVEGLEVILMRAFDLHQNPMSGGLHDINLTGKDYVPVMPK